MLFSSFYGLLRILIVGPLAYLLLIVILRISGKRTLAKMNAFDFVVTVALGSTLATVLLSKDVPLAEGVLGFLVLVVLQFVVAKASQRVRAMADVIKAEPRALLRDGEIDHTALIDERVTEKEVKGAVRKAGVGDLSKVAAVYLESDGSFSVITQDDAGSRSAFPNSGG